MATTYRSDIVAALVAILEEESTASPTLLRKVYPSRPGSFGETPVAWVGPRDETITHDAGTRTRTFAGLQVLIADAYRDNQQTGDLLDDLVDELVDRFDVPGAAGVQKVPNSVIQLTSVTDTDIELAKPDGGSVIYRGVVLTFGGSSKLEGRD